MAIKTLPTTLWFLHPRWLLARQADAFLALISRSATEDKNQPWALFSLQPWRVTGLLYSAWDLWDDHLWWPGCPSFAVMFSKIMMLPLCLRPQKTTIRLVTAQKWLLTAPLRGEKIFSFPSTPSDALYSHFNKAYLWSCSSAKGCIRFDGDGGDLNRPWYNSWTWGTSCCTGNQKLWAGRCTLFVGHYVCSITKPRISHPSEVCLIFLLKRIVRLCFRFILLHQLYVIYRQRDSLQGID